MKKAETLDIGFGMLYICNCNFNSNSVLNWHKRRSVASPFLFPLSYLLSKCRRFAPPMLHFSFLNLRFKQVKWLAFALKTSVVLVKSPVISDVEVWQNG